MSVFKEYASFKCVIHLLKSNRSLFQCGADARKDTKWTAFGLMTTSLPSDGSPKQRHHQSPLPQFMPGTDGEGNILQLPALVVSAATAHKTFGPTDLKSTYSVCTRSVFGGIEPRPSGLESDALTTRLSTALSKELKLLNK
ncbi:hypothetical protein TNCV_3204891 [Trichonephila clavipes]|nr:hypothetical protein TNCV_3204891 [Trichonephila clavipes]